MCFVGKPLAVLLLAKLVNCFYTQELADPEIGPNARDGYGLLQSNSHNERLARRSCGTKADNSIDRENHQVVVEKASSEDQNSRQKSDIVVPVCFHVVYDSEEMNKAASDESLQQQIDQLNRGFGSSSCCDSNSQAWCNGTERSCSISTGISFALAKLNANKSDVVYQEKDGTTSVVLVEGVTSEDACVTRMFHMEWANANETTRHERRQALRRGDITVLNVYIVKMIEFAGLATYPWLATQDLAYDGVDLGYEFQVQGKWGVVEGDTLVHEAGHWLGLLHTFEGGCDVSDGIDDTAPAAIPFDGCFDEGVANPAIPDTCPGDNRHDPVFNFMDFSSDPCLFLFTPLQARVMHTSWDLYRVQQWFYPNLVEEPLLNGLEIETLVAPFELRTYQLVVEIVGMGDVSISCDTNSKEGDQDLYMRVGGVPWFGPADDCVSETRGTSREKCTVFLRSSETRSFSQEGKAVKTPGERQGLFGKADACGLKGNHCAPTSLSPSPGTPTIIPVDIAPTRTPTTRGTARPSFSTQSVPPTFNPSVVYKTTVYIGIKAPHAVFNAALVSLKCQRNR